jgi:single-strand DNA-binding protein
MSLNKVMLIGRLGGDPELRHTQGGQAVANFSLATSERWKDKSDKIQERTEWHRVVAWGKTGETAAKYLTKGREVFIEGKIQTKEWQDKDGNKRYTTEIVAQSVTFIGSGSESSSNDGASKGGGVSKPTYEEDNFDQSFNDDDIPF